MSVPEETQKTHPRFVHTSEDSPLPQRPPGAATRMDTRPESSSVLALVKLGNTGKRTQETMKEYERDRGRGRDQKAEGDKHIETEAGTGTEAERGKTPGECNLLQLRKKDQ